MKSFAASTLLAIASAQSSDVTHPENTRVGKYTVKKDLVGCFLTLVVPCRH